MTSEPQLDYHDEFMSRIEEFSVSWRNAAIQEASKHTAVKEESKNQSTLKFIEI